MPASNGTPPTVTAAPFRFTGASTASWAGASVMVQVKDAVPVAAGDPLSVTVTVTFDVPDVLGVPEMTPVDAAMLSPAGRPVAA